MTLDEQISFCEEKSKNIKLKTEPQTFIDIKNSLEKLKNSWIPCSDRVPEECRAAMEKQTAKKATTNHSWTHYHFFCPVCKAKVNDMKYCPNCGQHIDWSDEE
nr:MAG TPA: hypothetical protein [Caudoviricetes sp.]